MCYEEVFGGPGWGYNAWALLDQVHWCQRGQYWKIVKNCLVSSTLEFLQDPWISHYKVNQYQFSKTLLFMGDMLEVYLFMGDIGRLYLFMGDIRGCIHLWVILLGVYLFIGDIVRGVFIYGW